MDVAEQSTQRASVIEVARQFIGTPYHDCAEIKGPNGGVDCATLIAMVFAEANIIAPVPLPQYSPQWHLHNSAELYMDEVLRHAKETTSPEEGDVVLYRLKLGRHMARCHSHGAIVVEWPRRVIHAFKRARMVIEGQAFEGELAGAETRFFTAW